MEKNQDYENFIEKFSDDKHLADKMINYPENDILLNYLNDNENAFKNPNDMMLHPVNPHIQHEQSLHHQMNYPFFHQDSGQMPSYTIKMSPHNIFNVHPSSNHIPHPIDDMGDNMGYKYIQAPANIYYSNPFGASMTRVKQEDKIFDSEGDAEGNKRKENEDQKPRKKRGGKSVSFGRNIVENIVDGGPPRRKNSKKKDQETAEEGGDNHPLKQIKREIRKNSLEENDHKFMNNKNVYLSKITNLIQSTPNDIWKSYTNSKGNKEEQVNSTGVLRTLKIQEDVFKNLSVPLKTKFSPSGAATAHEIKKIMSSDNIKSSEYGKLNEKLKRNREHARNSRKRKKIYLEMLEKKTQQLLDELNATKKAFTKQSENMNKLYLQNQKLSNLMMGKQNLFEKLEKSLKDKADDNELNLLIDSLRLRLGATGKDRIKILNELFKQIFEMVLPNYMKCILSISSSEDLDPFLSNMEKFTVDNIATLASGILDPEMVEFLRDLNITEQQIKGMLKYKKKLNNENSKIQNLIQKLNEIHKALRKETYELEDVVDEMRNLFSPSQIGKFLIFIENKKKKTFSGQKLWLKEEDQDDDENIGSDEESKINEVSFDNEQGKIQDIPRQENYVESVQKKRHVNYQF